MLNSEAKRLWAGGTKKNSTNCSFLGKEGLEGVNFLLALMGLSPLILYTLNQYSWYRRKE